MISASSRNRAAARRVVGVPVLDLLEGDLAVQLLVAGDEDLAQAPLGVRPEDAEPKPQGGRGSYPAASTSTDGAIRPAGDHADQTGMEIRIRDPFQVLPGCFERGDRAQAPGGIIVVQAQEFLDQGFEYAMPDAGQDSLFGEDLTEGSRLVDRP